VRLPQQRARHGNELEPLAERARDRVQTIDAAEQDQLHREGCSKSAGVGEEVRLFERVRLQEVASGDLEAELEHPRHRFRHLRERPVAAEQIHRVREGAAAGQLQRIQRLILFEQPRDLDAFVDLEAAAYAIAHIELRSEAYLVL